MPHDNVQQDSPRTAYRRRPFASDTIVNITQLAMQLPQGQAATVLGVSESMLCKRFKVGMIFQHYHDCF
jgi:hypothetical protein